MRIHLAPRIRTIPVFVALLVAAASAAAQGVSPRPSRITQAVDESQLVTLRGNTHPLAISQNDIGLAPDSLPMERMMLVLQRSPDQEAALKSLLEAQQDKNSPSYHQWLTPAQFGRQFGPSDADIQTVTNWLASQGFQVTKVGAGRTAIEFSGIAGQVRNAFHTEIHKYMINGEQRWANASDPQIPAALAPVVVGVNTLHNIPRRRMIVHAGTRTHTMAPGERLPFFTTSSGHLDLGPTDFATIYNTLPLWNGTTPAGMLDGTGVSIAIVGDSNICTGTPLPTGCTVDDVTQFRNLFGLSGNNTQIVLNGTDPGLAGGEGEGILDAEWAGGVAKGATILFVVSADTLSSFGTDLSAFFIVDNNLAPIVSESLGACEAGLGASGNAFFNAIWEQAAAQGISAFVSAGDAGSDACDDFNTAATAKSGVGVNGIASTPFNIAVGGTDFDNTLPTPGTYQSTFWNSTNASGTRASAKSYISETTWNNNSTGTSQNCPSGLVTCILAGSGGQSAVYTTRPTWQMGPGIPTTPGPRLLPDVSLFASNGHNLSAYVVCQADAIPATAPPSCNPAGGSFSFLGVGGTSASTPAMAGIMAMVVEKFGRQGNANFVFYPLAAKSGNSCDSSNPLTIGSATCIFQDITKGNISVPCMAGSPNCGTAMGVAGFLVDPANTSALAWTTTTGFDRATGLGSVNGANLVNHWSDVTFSSTTTTLGITSTPPFTHGTSINLAITVKANSGTAFPTGNVSLIDTLTAGRVGVDAFTLANTVTPGTSAVPTANATSIFFPGGAYNVTAHYAGDGTFGSSDSTPVAVTVNPENSLTTVEFVTFDVNGNPTAHTGTATAAYGSPYILRILVTNMGATRCDQTGVVVGYDCPTGTLAVTDNGAPLDPTVFNGKLDSFGVTEDTPIQLPGGSHAILANYPGNDSYNASSGNVAVTITKAATATTLGASSTSVGSGQNVTLTATIATVSNGAAPTGTVTFFNGATAIPGTPTLTPTNGSASTPAQLVATLTTSFTANASVTAQYSGDGNYVASTSAPATMITVTAPDFSVSVSPSSQTTSAGTAVAYTVTITPAGGFTSAVTLSCSNISNSSAISCGAFNPPMVTPGTTPGNASTFNVTASSSAFLPTGPGAPRMRPWQPLYLLCALLALLSSIVLWLAARKPALPRRQLCRSAALAGLALSLALTIAGCNNSGGGGKTPQNFTFTVTGSSGATVHQSATVTLTVQ